MEPMVAIQKQLEERGAVLAIVPGYDFRYLMGWSPLPDERLTVLWLGAGGSLLLIAGVNAEEARAKLPATVEVVAFQDADDPIQAAREAWTRTTAKTPASLVYLSQDARFDHSQILKVALGPTVDWQLASSLVAPLRVHKSAGEVEALQRSQAINDSVMRRAFAAIKPGISEVSLADLIRRAFVEEGADRDAFVIVAFGANAAHPHHAPDQTQVFEGPVLLDIGCYKDGYASDMTRMAYIGQPSARYVEVHAAVERASQAGLEAVRIGMPVGRVDQASRGAIVAAGFGPNFVHRTGHGIGLEVHEPPSVTSDNAEPMVQGMAFSIEPGIYLPNEFGVRLEDVVVVQAGGAQVLSEIPRSVYAIS